MSYLCYVWIFGCLIILYGSGGIEGTLYRRQKNSKLEGHYTALHCTLHCLLSSPLTLKLIKWTGPHYVPLYPHTSLILVCQPKSCINKSSTYHWIQYWSWCLGDGGHPSYVGSPLVNVSTVPAPGVLQSLATKNLEKTLNGSDFLKRFKEMLK